ncbi:MAG: thiamine pyrophosphate-binding protein [Ginsengibacter sp.]
MNAPERLLKILIDAGGRNVYGVTADALNFFFKAIEKSEEIDWRTFKHEGNASFAAFGESETVTANH